MISASSIWNPQNKTLLSRRLHQIKCLPKELDFKKKKWQMKRNRQTQNKAIKQGGERLRIREHAPGHACTYHRVWCKDYKKHTDMTPRWYLYLITKKVCLENRHLRLRSRKLLWSVILSLCYSDCFQMSKSNLEQLVDATLIWNEEKTTQIMKQCEELKKNDGIITMSSGMYICWTKTFPLGDKTKWISKIWSKILYSI